MKNLFFCIGIAVVLFSTAAINTAKVSAENTNLKENKKIVINDNYYFKYAFSEKVKLGLSVIKISVYDKDGNKVDNLDIIGGYDMPQMRGHHSSGPVKFQKNKNNDYLMPLNSVMRGKWEILLIFTENGEEIYSGAINIII